MPLLAGTSDEVWAHNYTEMLKAGHPPSQAAAASYEKQRESKRKKRKRKKK